MKKLITLVLLFLSTFAYSQISDTAIVKNNTQPEINLHLPKLQLEKKLWVFRWQSPENLPNNNRYMSNNGCLYIILRKNKKKSKNIY
jgi:hypothetical protein